MQIIARLRREQARNMTLCMGGTGARSGPGPGPAAPTHWGELLYEVDFGSDWLYGENLKTRPPSSTPLLIDAAAAATTVPYTDRQLMRRPRAGTYYQIDPLRCQFFILYYYYYKFGRFKKRPHSCQDRIFKNVSSENWHRNGPILNAPARGRHMVV